MNRHCPPKGFTLVEVVVSMAVLTVILLMLNMIMRASLLSAEMTSNQADAESRAAAAMDLMARELKDGGSKYSEFYIGQSQQYITFARCNGYANGKPIFGNKITYAIATYGSSICLERTEIVNGQSNKQILSDQLSGTTVSMTTAQGIPINVSGVNFQILNDGVLTITLALAKSNYLLKQNSTTPDDTLVVISQASVQMSND